MAEDYFAKLEYGVEDVSKRESYDVRCRRPGVELHVEVKGTMGDGTDVFLTKGEVQHARTNTDRMVLVVVSKIRIDFVGDQITARGGELQVIRPWNVDEGELLPLQFKYRPPALQG